MTESTETSRVDVIRAKLASMALAEDVEPTEADISEAVMVIGEIRLDAFEAEVDLREYVAKEWDTGRVYSHMVVTGHRDAPTTTLDRSRAWVAGYEAHQQMSDGEDVAPGFTLGAQIRQYEAAYRFHQAERLIEDSAKASMSPLMHEYRSDEHQQAMAIVEQYGAFVEGSDAGRAEFAPYIVRSIDVDAIPLAHHEGVSLDAAREIVCKRMTKMAGDAKLATRVDMRFDLGVDLLAPQIVFAKVPRTTRAWLERGEQVWAFWYLPDVWVPRDGGPSRSSWWHDGEWIPDPTDPEARGSYQPGIMGCVAVYTDESKAARECKALLRAVLTLRRISAENADGHEYEDDPVRRVGLDDKPVTRRNAQMSPI